MKAKRSLSLPLDPGHAGGLHVRVCGSSVPADNRACHPQGHGRTNSFYPNQNLGDVANMKAYEEMTGVHIEWENVDPSVFNNTLAASIAGDELPDIIMKAALSNSQMFEWGEDEILVDIAALHRHLHAQLQGSAGAVS